MEGTTSLLCQCQKCYKFNHGSIVTDTMEGTTSLLSQCQKCYKFNHGSIVTDTMEGTTSLLSQCQKSPSFTFPLIPSALLPYRLQEIPPPLHPPPPTPQSRIETTSLRMQLVSPPFGLSDHVSQNEKHTLRKGPTPPVSSVDDG